MSLCRVGSYSLTAFAMATVLAASSPAVWAASNNDSITIVLGAEPPNIDGCMSTNTYQGLVIKQNVVETLIERNHLDGSLMPRLATSWNKIDDRTWRFNLRKGVTFHDGSPLNAQTVKRSLDRTMNKTIPCGDRVKMYVQVSLEVVAVDDSTIDVRTADPDPILPVRLATTAIFGPNVPMDEMRPAGAGEIGTGPYVVDHWTPGQEIVLKRNDKYWGNQPKIGMVRYVWRGESSVRASMVKIGEADIAQSIAQQDADDPKMDFSYLNSETTFLRIDMTRPPLTDKRVRLALNYAVDRAALIGTIMPKSVIQATQIVIPAIPGHNFDLDKKPYAYDPAKAKQLLAEAKAGGVATDAEITLISYPGNFPNAGELMESLFTMFKAVGLNMKLLTVEPGQYAKWNIKPFPEDRPPTLLQTSHDNNNGDPVFSVTGRYTCDGRASTVCDPELDKRVLSVMALEGKARVDGWSEIFRIIYQDVVPDVMLHHMVAFTRVSPRLAFVPDASNNAELRIQEIGFK